MASISSRSEMVDIYADRPKSCISSFRAFFSDTHFLRALAFNGACNLTVLCIYYSIGYLGDLRYLRWAEAQSSEVLELILSDIVIDYLPEAWNSPDTVLEILKHIPPLFLGVGLFSLILGRYSDLINHLLWCQILLLAGKGISEQVTIMPSSQGYTRCITSLGITSSAEYQYSWSLAGTCSGQMYSGHTMHAMLGVFALLCACERKWPHIWIRAVFGSSVETGLSLKFFLTLMIGIVEAVLLVMNLGHYTSDVIIAIVFTLLILGSDKIAYWASLCNPFLRKEDIVMPLRVVDAMKRVVEDKTDSFEVVAV